MTDYSYRKHLDSLPKERLSAYQEWRKSGEALPLPLGFFMLASGLFTAALLTAIAITIVCVSAAYSVAATTITMMLGFFIWALCGKHHESRFDRIVGISTAGLALTFVVTIAILVRLMELPTP